ncbi:unnamed protein product [Pleuronectes platessa]|uniref:Uncharacterized protein n=1 Tax=Pleuronectes platessa TaxID=8262 RepID=A0A9N7VTZ4_PLEPL|nr:unnamed protein product [Pleuronectes platessa]
MSQQPNSDIKLSWATEGKSRMERCARALLVLLPVTGLWAPGSGGTGAHSTGVEACNAPVPLCPGLSSSPTVCEFIHRKCRGASRVAGLMRRDVASPASRELSMSGRSAPGKQTPPLFTPASVGGFIKLRMQNPHVNEDLNLGNLALLRVKVQKCMVTFSSLGTAHCECATALGNASTMSEERRERSGDGSRSARRIRDARIHEVASHGLLTPYTQSRPLPNQKNAWVIHLR